MESELNLYFFLLILPLHIMMFNVLNRSLLVIFLLFKKQTAATSGKLSISLRHFRPSLLFSDPVPSVWPACLHTPRSVHLSVAFKAASASCSVYSEQRQQFPAPHCVLKCDEKGELRLNVSMNLKRPKRAV